MKLNPRFLTSEHVVAIHEDQISRYGGGRGVRDLGLLQSAMAQPRASFGGEWLHPTLFDMAAAYQPVEKRRVSVSLARESS